MHKVYFALGNFKFEKGYAPDDVFVDWLKRAYSGAGKSVLIVEVSAENVEGINLNSDLYEQCYVDDYGGINYPSGAKLKQCEYPIKPELLKRYQDLMRSIDAIEMEMTDDIYNDFD